MRSISILVVDDHEIVRCGFCTLLERRPGWTTVQAADGYDAVSKAVALHPDVVVMDINMPHRDGLEAAREIHKQIPTLPVVFLSGYSPDEVIDKALEVGVRGYLVKTDAAKDLMAAVDAVLQGRTFFTASVSRRLLEGIQHPPARDNMALTVRETEIVQLLCAGKSNKDVAGELNVSPRTVESHRARIMEKLHLRTFSDLIRYAVRNMIIQL